MWHGDGGALLNKHCRRSAERRAGKLTHWINKHLISPNAKENFIFPLSHESKASSIMLTPFYFENHGHEFVTQNTEPTITAGETVDCMYSVLWTELLKVSVIDAVQTHKAALMLHWGIGAHPQPAKPRNHDRIMPIHGSNQEISQYKFKTNSCRASPGCVSPYMPV